MVEPSKIIFLMTYVVFRGSSVVITGFFPGKQWGSRFTVEFGVQDSGFRGPKPKTQSFEYSVRDDHCTEVYGYEDLGTMCMAYLRISSHTPETLHYLFGGLPVLWGATLKVYPCPTNPITRQ